MRYSGSGVMVNLGVYIYVDRFQTLSLFSHLVIMWSYECSPLKQLWFVETKTKLFCLNSNSKHNICREMSSAHHPSIPNIRQSGGSIMLWECFSAVEAERLVSVEEKSWTEQSKKIFAHAFVSCLCLFFHVFLCLLALFCYTLFFNTSLPKTYVEDRILI